MKSKGRFITFEGGEGAGKTTLIEKVAEKLASQGHSVVVAREPGGTRVGEEIRNLLLHHKDPLSPYAELSLFLAARAQQIHEVIRPALAAGKIVLCDRFNDSSIAYQGAARHLGVEEVSAFCQFICQRLTPHLTLYLDIDPELGLARAKQRRSQDKIESEDITFHVTIRNAYLAMQRREPQRLRLLDASKEPSQVFQAAMQWIEALSRPLAQEG
ncbi:MAG: dTMP kinase [Chlamydiia bacterium]|nr:dTMP kinase [Chlamydiia bacterium]